jgi:CBS domain-containing protein
MFPGIDRLRTLKVRDVMSHKVIEISANQTMSEAAKAFAQGDISSAPVVDDQGRCIGMLSAADFIKRDCLQRGERDRHETTKRPDDPVTSESTSDIVGRYMSSAPKSVTADSLVLQAARAMSAEHIHHLPVLEEQRPIGLVSTMDIVAALINAVDEVQA